MKEFLIGFGVIILFFTAVTFLSFGIGSIISLFDETISGNFLELCMMGGFGLLVLICSVGFVFMMYALGCEISNK